MKKSVILALVILFVLVAYFGIRSLTRSSHTDAVVVSGGQTVLEAEAANQKERLKVVTTDLFAEPHEVFLTLKGRTAPNRTVTVRAATTGTVTAAPDLEGRAVSEGTLLCRLDIEARRARVAEAEANLEARRVDYEAAATLSEKGWASPNRTSSAKATLDAAEASLDAAKIELRRTELRAPFAGVFETRLAETGDFLSPGGACGVVADLDPLRIEVDVTEEYADRIVHDAPVSISVLDDAPRQGEITYIARTANEATRTFRVEASLANPDNAIAAGLTTDLKISLGQADAIRLSPALLTLDETGQLGVRHVDDSNTVVFSAVTVVDDTSDGIWVTGLPERTRIITAGQEYISAGARVETLTVAEPAR